MWLPRLQLLLLLRFSGVFLVQGLNTCQSINLDAQKSRRIEAVRGQILSKLRIRSPPDDDDDEAPPSGPVPPEVMLLYNSTRELQKERARLAESTCERESSEEDYYAKEVQRIDMLPPRTATSESMCELWQGFSTCGPGTTERSLTWSRAQKWFPTFLAHDSFHICHMSKLCVLKSLRRVKYFVNISNKTYFIFHIPLIIRDPLIILDPHRCPKFQGEKHSFYWFIFNFFFTWWVTWTDRFNFHQYYSPQNVKKKILSDTA